MKRYRSLWLMFLAFNVFAGAATAQQITSPYRYVEEKQSLGAYVGTLSTDGGSLGLGPQSGTFFGLRYNIVLGGPFVIEADLGYFPSTRDVFTTDTAAVPSDSIAPVRTRVGEADVAIITALASLRFNLTGQRTWHRLMPYIVFGGGTAFDVTGDVDAAEGVPPAAVVDFGTSFAGSLGAGVEWFATRRLGVRAEFRDLLWQVETPDAFLGGKVPADEWVQNLTFTVGGSYHF